MISFDIFPRSQREHNETIGTLLGFPFPFFPQAWNIPCKYMNAGASDYACSILSMCKLITFMAT